MSDVLKDLQGHQHRISAKQTKYPKQAGLPKNEEMLSPVQSEFIDWLLDPTRKGTQKQWGIDHGVNEQTVADWKRTAWFVKAWRERAEKLNGGPERTQVIVDALYEAAKQDWRAAQAYLQWIEKTSPPKPKPVHEGALRDMSDEEFEAKLEAYLRKGTPSGEV